MIWLIVVLTAATISNFAVAHGVCRRRRRLELLVAPPVVVQPVLVKPAA